MLLYIHQKIHLVGSSTVIAILAITVLVVRTLLIICSRTKLKIAHVGYLRIQTPL